MFQWQIKCGKAHRMVVITVLETPKRTIIKSLTYFYAEPLDFIRLRRLKLSLDKRKIILFGSPVHGNIGDHLIAQSEIDFFSEYFTNYLVFDFSMEFTRRNFNELVSSVNDNDLIAISGGGWLGSEWTHDEDFVRKIILSFPHNPIIIFPQTVYYKNHDDYFIDGRKIYSSHKNLIFCLRDNASYKLVLNEGFVANPGQAFLCPDFALFYKTNIRYTGNSKICICFRNDKEKVLSDSLKDKVNDLVKDNSFLFTTSKRNRVIPIRKRQKAINETLHTIAESKLVITDRLHAMIMCALTGTPCLAFDNSTHKVYGVYKWLAGAGNIYLVDSYDSFQTRLDQLCLSTSIGNYHRSEEILQEIKKRILEIINYGE